MCQSKISNQPMKMNCTKVVSRKQAFGPSIVDYDLIAS